MKYKYKIYRCYEDQCIFDREEEMEEAEANYLALYNEDLLLRRVDEE